VLWAKDIPVTGVIDDAEIDTHTGVDTYQWLREVCTTKLLQTPIVLVPQTIVKVDETLFRHKPKVSYHGKTHEIHVQTQNNIGRCTQQEIWVLGMVDTSSSPALGYMEIVQQRDAATLLPIINAHAAPGTVVHTDKWAAYRRLGSLPNVSLNHSLHFVDPVTGTHTQTVESYWNRCKTNEKRMKGCTAFPSYLDKFMWRECHSTSRRLAFTNIMRDIANQYPVP